jgi:hypothetical protein
MCTIIAISRGVSSERSRSGQASSAGARAFLKGASWDNPFDLPTTNIWRIPVDSPYAIGRSADASHHVRYNYGIDFNYLNDHTEYEANRDLYAITSGVVEYVHPHGVRDTWYNGGMGNYVIIKHSLYYRDVIGMIKEFYFWVRYLHNERVTVRPGYLIDVHTAYPDFRYARIGRYGNTPGGIGIHSHIDAWILDTHSSKARASGLTPTGVTRHWDGMWNIADGDPLKRETFRNVNLSAMFQSMNINVRTGGVAPFYGERALPILPTV